MIIQCKGSFWQLSLHFSMKIWIVYYSEAYYICFFTVKLRVSIFFTKGLIKLLLSTHVKQILALSNLQYECLMAIILVFSQPQSIFILLFENSLWCQLMFVDFCVFLFFWSGWRNKSLLDFGTSFSWPKCKVGTGLAALGISSIKWIEHTLSLFPGSQTVLSLFSLFRAFIHIFLFASFFKTLEKQCRKNGFSQSLQFPLVMQLPGT